jgi:hypothetical protein
VEAYDEIFSVWQDDLESYAIHSDELRTHFAVQKRRFPILYREGGFIWLE